VQGHVDGTATVLETADGDGWRRVRFSLAPELSPLVVDKGSIAIDGVSLTVSAVSAEDTPPEQAWFEVSLIPETLEATTLGARVPGDRVNIETDVLARHVRRMLRLDAAAGASAGALSGSDSGSGPGSGSGSLESVGLEER